MAGPAVRPEPLRYAQQPGSLVPQVPAGAGNAHPEPGEQSRRAVIVGAGIAAVAGAAGFAWFATAGPKPGPTSSAGGYPAPTGSTTPSAAALATVAEIPEGGGLVLAEQGVVLIRKTGDKVHGFSSVCTHAGCPVNEVAGGKISCPCHGSSFDAATGAVLGGPAPAPLPAVAVTVSNGSVFRG